MIKSDLATSVVAAHSSNYTSGRRGYKVCKFTPHHMAGVLTAGQCGRIFQNPGRNASSNYGIGNNGEIACYVGEENRAWTSSSSSNDCQAITVEVSNNKTGGDWTVSDAAWNSLVNLAVDVCRRYNFRLTFDGTPKGSLTYHQMFANTNCPGPYLKSRMNELVNIVNGILDGGNAPSVPNNTNTNSGSHKVGETVTINGIYTASNSSKKLNPARNSGVITKIVSGALNPYLLDNGNLGWTNDGCIVGSSAPVTESKPATNNESGYLVQVTTDALNIRSGAGTNNPVVGCIRDRGTYTIVETKGNWGRLKSGAGWICLDYTSKSGSVNSAPVQTSSEIKKGDKVKVLNNVDYNGTRLNSNVKGGIYDVIQANGDRIVIGKGSAVTAAMNKSTLQKV